MITKVVHGWRVGGLISYLMGPGRAQEHDRPRVIASWDGRDAFWQPASTGPSPYDLDLGPLIRAMRAPAVAAGLPDGDPDGKRGYVWHCSARLSFGDRVLTDAEWAGVVRELLDGAGLALTGDTGGPRWVAIRHADDHVHIAVVLVRQDSGRRFWPSRDYVRLREAAQRIEKRLGLMLTASADGTAAPAPTRGEWEKAARQGREPGRIELARVVRSAAVASDGVAGFVAELEAVGCVVEVRVAPSGDPIGYKVARAEDVTADGRPVFYSGSKLAPDLSLPKLLAAWRGAEGGLVADPVAAAARRVGQAQSSVVGARRGEGGEDPGLIAHAAADVLTALRDRSPDLDAAAAVFDRASRPPRGTAGATGPVVAGLRLVARQLIRARHPTRSWNDPAAGGVALVVALAALVQELSAWQWEQGRVHQSAASANAAASLGRWVATVAGDGAGHAPGHGVTGPQQRIDRAPGAALRRPRG